MNLDVFSKIKGLKVLICGDVMIDRYLLGAVNRISPEAPVPVLDYQNTENRLGGAANVTLNVQALGAIPYTCGVIGKDENGSLFQEIMGQRGLSTDYLVQSAGRQTTTKTRVIANKHHLLRVDREDSHDLSTNEESDLMEQVDLCLDKENIDLIILQDYNKGVLTSNTIDFIMSRAKAAGIFTAVDPKKRHFFKYNGVHLFKPNLKEVSESMHRSFLPNKSDMDLAAHQLHIELEHTTTLITLSGDGLYIGDQHQSQIIPTRKRNIVDVCGAGDTVLSIAALCLSQGIDYKITGELSNLAGGQVCERVGVVPVNLEQLIIEAT
jgi:rfaE bifunctional protein kinase chain/domain